MVALAISLLALGMHLEFRDSVDDKVAAAMMQFQQQLAETMVIARDARTTAKTVEREHLEEISHAK